MKKTLLAFTMCLFTVAGINAQTIDYSNYHLIFHDYFEYDTATFLSDTAFTNKWTTNMDCWSPWGLLYYANSYDNISMPAVGVLKLTETTTPSHVGPCGTTIDHYSGAIKTKTYYGYGIIEASIKISNDTNTGHSTDYHPACSAFWSNSFGVAPTEIDVVDVAENSYWPNRVIDWTYYVPGTPPIPPHKLSNGFPEISRNLSDSFHLYSGIWTPDSVTFYLDRQFVRSVRFDTIRTYPHFEQWSIALLADSNTHDGISMYVDTVRIWRPNCNMSYLDVNTITTRVGDCPYYDTIIPGLYKYDSIVSNNNIFDDCGDGGTFAGTHSPIIFEGNSVTILPNFVADQSKLDSSYVIIDGPGPVRQYTNGYFEILPLKCDDDNSAGYNWFRTMTHDSTQPYNNLSARGTPASKAAGTITISPNPVISTVNISYPCTLTGSLEITITDVVGRVVYIATVNCTDGNTVQHSIDMSSYMQGVYFVALTLSSEHVVKKIVKL